MKSRNNASFLLSGFVGIVAAGMAGCNGKTGYNIAPNRLERGVVFVLHGIEGPGYLNEEICRGLYMGGVDCAIKNYEWSSLWGPLHNLRAERENREKARKLAREIESYRQAYPGKPVFLIGHSGGAAIAVWASEYMTGDNKIEGIILLNAALSRNYDLTSAMSNTKRGIVNLHSNYDWFFLGVGTSMAGTMDGKHAESAGKDGFIAGDKQYNRLFQVGWTEKMLTAGHVGGHISSATAHFVALYVAPLVLVPEWNDKTINRIQEGKGISRINPALNKAARRFPVSMKSCF